jgi:hypothetical protein
MYTRKQKIIAISTALALLAAIAGYWLYIDHQKRALRDTVTAWIVDAGRQLSSALSVEPASVTADEDATIKSLEARTAAVAKNRVALRALDASLQQPLVDGADYYLLSVIEILRQHASSRRHGHLASIGLRGLWAHMRSRYSQGLGWTTEALRRKELLEKEFFRYRIAADALIRLLESYPEDRARIALLVDAAKLPDEKVISAARVRALEAAKRMANEMERLRKLPATP